MLCALAVAAVAVLAAAAQPVSGGRIAGGPVHADLDGDRVFDDLEARAASLGADDGVDVIVRLRERATRARIERLEADVGELEVARRFTVLRGFSARLTKPQLAALARDPSVVRLEPVLPVRGSNDKAQASFGVAKAFSDAPWLDGDRDGAPGSYSKDDVVVAVVDSGVDATHPDLDGGKVIYFKDAVKDPPEAVAYDDNGHGTHIAGIVAGTGEASPLYRGVAPGAAIVAVKVLDRLLKGDSNHVIEGMEWVYNNVDDFNIRVVNLSLEATGVCSASDSLVDLVN